LPWLCWRWLSMNSCLHSYACLLPSAFRADKVAPSCVSPVTYVVATEPLHDHLPPHEPKATQAAAAAASEQAGPSGSSNWSDGGGVSGVGGVDGTASRALAGLQVRDVTPRYAHTSVDLRKLRDSAWWDATLR
jgi:hypothetical protein